MARRFGRRRWRTPQRMTLEGPPVVRRKDLVVPDLLSLESGAGWQANRKAMAGLLAVFFAAAALWGLVVGLILPSPWAPWVGATLGAGLALLYLVVGGRFGDEWIRRALRAEPMDTPVVDNMLDGVTRAVKTPAPELYRLPGEAINALSLGLRRRWLVLTDGACRTERLELEGLLAHELVHLRDGDAALASAYVLVGGAPELATKGVGARGWPLAFLATPIWPACLVIRLLRPAWFDGGREHRADVAGALTTRYPPGLRSALRRSAVEHGPARLRVTDPFWFAPRSGVSEDEIVRRAKLVGEM